MQRFENKYDLLNTAYKDKNLKKGAVTLFQYLVHKSNREQCFPSIDTIAKALNVCKRTVQYNMRKLEAAGYIIRKDRYYNHQQLSNQYIFNFGVTEEHTLSSERYSECEKESMSDAMSISEESIDVNKSKALLKIYELPYSSREKLLLIYFYHKANCKGLVYIEPQEIMNAIGVGPQTYYKLLSSLRKEGLIKVKYMTISGKRHLIVKLTGSFVQNTEQKSTDQKITTRKVVHKSQNKYDLADVNRGCKKSRISKLFERVMSRCKQTIRHVINIAYRVLRL